MPGLADSTRYATPSGHPYRGRTTPGSLVHPPGMHRLRSQASRSAPSRCRTPRPGHLCVRWLTCSELPGRRSDVHDSWAGHVRALHRRVYCSCPVWWCSVLACTGAVRGQLRDRPRGRPADPADRPGDGPNRMGQPELPDPRDSLHPQPDRNHPVPRLRVWTILGGDIDQAAQRIQRVPAWYMSTTTL